jgi:hypothetical protein
LIARIRVLGCQIEVLPQWGLDHITSYQAGYIGRPAVPTTVGLLIQTGCDALGQNTISDALGKVIEQRPNVRN